LNASANPGNSTSAADVAEIIQLTVRYANALDDRDWQSLHGCLAERCLFRGGVHNMTLEGPTSVIDYLATATENFVSVQHFVSNHLYLVDGDGASGSCSFLAYHWPKSADERVLILAGRYVDQLERVGGEWLIAERRIDIRSPRLAR
jgi:SnoaL-like domain